MSRKSSIAIALATVATVTIGGVSLTHARGLPGFGGHAAFPSSQSCMTESPGAAIQHNASCAQVLYHWALSTDSVGSKTVRFNGKGTTTSCTAFVVEQDNLGGGQGPQVFFPSNTVITPISSTVPVNLLVFGSLWGHCNFNNGGQVTHVDWNQ